MLIFSEMQKDRDGGSYNEVFYAQKRDVKAEQWNGKRLGVEGVKEKLGFDRVFNAEEFLNADMNFSKFENVVFFDFKNDFRDTNDPADIFDLIRVFKEKSNYPSDYDATKQHLYSMIRSTELENSANVAQTLGRYLNYYQELKSDKLLVDYVEATDDRSRIEIKEKVALQLKSNNLNSAMLEEIMNTLREIKTKKYGAEYEGYPSIVGGGNNGCILHYIENNKPKVGNDLVLMDLGAEYHGYTADVTRTIPANGKFSKDQKQIYDIVYKAQEAGIKASVVGASFQAPGQAASEVVAKGLMQLGIIGSPEEARKYFPHGTSHYLGLDVHDKGTYQPFKENTVITVEPGIYIPEGSECDKRWWGIAVRIEDDILITKNGPVNLSAMAPRTTEAIEAVMKQSSPLEQFKLPALEELGKF